MTALIMAPALAYEITLARLHQYGGKLACELNYLLSEA